MSTAVLVPAELDQYFFGIMDGTQLDVAEYLEEVGIPRWGEDRSAWLASPPNAHHEI